MHPLPPRSGDPIGFAHRGGASGRRENTLDAFASALRRGATGLESDAWITAEGQVVLHHDGVTGPRWRPRPISNQTRQELPVRVPSLGDLYRSCGRDFELSLDLKDLAALPAILAEAKARGTTRRLWLCQDDWRWLAGGRAVDADAGLVHSTRLGRVAGGLTAHAARLRDAGIDVLNLHRADWTAERVATVHAAGIRAFGWDAQSRRQIVALLRMDIDGVYSDHVGVLMAAIAAESGLRQRPGIPPEGEGRRPE
jgi:glycerophosphoryl diester phosphodiesterase